MTEPADQDVPDTFTGEPMHEYFCQAASFAGSVTMPASPMRYPWPVGPEAELPSTYVFRGQAGQVDRFMADTDTTALVVLQHGRLRHESYFLTGGPEVQWLSMSVAKSFVSALVGIAQEEALISSLDEPISHYISVDPGSAYDGTTIRSVLQMSSGARWSEDYTDPESDIFRLTSVLHGVGTFDRFVAESVREFAPGTVCRYNSTDTQALASLLVSATGVSVADYLYQKLLHPLGTESAGQWLVDSEGQAAASFGLNLTARDYARLGELYRNGGWWQGRQLVPEDYVALSTRALSPHTQAGRVLMESEQWNMGYGYQWWIPQEDPGEFAAIGVYNQFLYINPMHGAVIVKLSANRRYGTGSDEATNRDLENLEVLRTIARCLD